VERTRTSDFRKRDWSGDKGKGKPTKGIKAHIISGLYECPYDTKTA
jgi:hypothetical protein